MAYEINILTTPEQKQIRKTEPCEKINFLFSSLLIYSRREVRFY